MSRAVLNNDPGLLACQVAPVLFRGGTGEGKSSVMEALAGAPAARQHSPAGGLLRLPHSRHEGRRRSHDADIVGR